METKVEEKNGSALAIPEKFKSLATELNSTVMGVVNSETIAGFEKAYTVAVAVQKLQAALTPEYMKPIMALQGNRLGFKTDKDKDGGYDEGTVKRCLIEAVLMGLQPYGNEFNIIAGNSYATKEGLGSLLKKRQGLSYEIIPGLPRIDTTKGSAAVMMKIKWMLNGAAQERDIEFAIKVNNFMGADAVIGKATRKARKWLHDTISGFEIPEGDVGDMGNGVKAEEISLDDLRELLDAKRDQLSVADLKDATRIVNNNETASFKKLRDKLAAL